MARIGRGFYTNHANPCSLLPDRERLAQEQEGKFIPLRVGYQNQTFLWDALRVLLRF